MKKDLIVMGFILIWFALMGYAVISTTSELVNQQEEVREMRQWPPAIEDCGLPTWDEIRGECNERAD